MVVQPHGPAAPRDTIQEISQHLAEELRGVETILQEVVNSESPLIREVGEYICLANGKKLRPMVNVLAARAFGPTGEVSLHLASAMELVHVATLLHDDVIDKAAMRRGKPSVNARWGDDVAILMADYLYASAFDLALEHLEPEPLKLICQVTRRMCEGEMFQIEKRGQWLTAEDYLHLITCKTGYLFSACAALGGSKAGLEPEPMASLAAFGLDFGLAFQITDDALDYTADDDQWGKGVGQDLAAGKQTLPLILTLEDAGEDERGQIETILSQGRDPGPIHESMRRSRAFDRSLEIAREYALQSVGHLEGLEVYDRAAHEFLMSLPEYVLDRKY